VNEDPSRTENKDDGGGVRMLRGSVRSRQTKVFCRHSSIEAAANYNFELNYYYELQFLLLNFFKYSKVQTCPNFCCNILMNLLLKIDKELLWKNGKIFFATM
jgi:hypothetical protein